MTGKEELTRGDALARVAVLEAENAALRKRVCVPDATAALEELVTACWDFSSESVECKYDGFHSEVVASREWDKFRAAVEAADGVLAAAPAPVERCDTCHGYGEVPAGETQRFGDLQPPEPIMMACPECDGQAPVERVEQETRSAGNLPCPFCGCDVDPKGWLRGDGVRGPECDNCGATAASLEAWNKRTTPQPAPTAAQDVAGLVEALQSIYDEDYQVGHDATDSEVSIARKQCIYRIRRKVKDALAAHQSGGAK
ncbi:hypothetical protein BXT89_14270 [Halopseudomonas pachastrellae]|uniref:Uncharacterized protein n=1 Tax=Halopseudomonas pachastrellae TaxID=254161 RepID=A0A1S8DE81_9GAMM|nr:hypothetical protein [Halopseudomonas pachastrellae]ONM43116.1 hypothetical protein BXT89_14270 [Halopseudomonas pachastrellae]SFL70657.1 hypothetical protein SAMN05216256_10173 [Halopseudomonas pachastrellae]